MLLNDQDCQLVLVDFQTRLIPAIHAGDDAVTQALKLARGARLLGVPVWATEQNPEGLGPTVPALRELCPRVLRKSHFSAVADGLAERLRPSAVPPAGNARSLPKHLQKPKPAAPERETIVLAGLEAHVCVLQTALELAEDEFDVVVVTDACGSRSERNRDGAFDRLAAAGVELVTVEMVLFEWLRSHQHPRFKEVLALIK